MRASGALRVSALAAFAAIALALPVRGAPTLPEADSTTRQATGARDSLASAARARGACSALVVARPPRGAYLWDRCTRTLLSLGPSGDTLNALRAGGSQSPRRFAAFCRGQGGDLLVLDAASGGQILHYDSILHQRSPQPLPPPLSQEPLSDALVAFDARWGLYVATAHPPRLWRLGFLRNQAPYAVGLPEAASALDILPRGPVVRTRDGSLAFDWLLAGLRSKSGESATGAADPPSTSDGSPGAPAGGRP